MMLEKIHLFEIKHWTEFLIVTNLQNVSSYSCLHIVLKWSSCDTVFQVTPAGDAILKLAVFSNMNFLNVVTIYPSLDKSWCIEWIVGYLTLFKCNIFKQNIRNPTIHMLCLCLASFVFQQSKTFSETCRFSYLSDGGGKKAVWAWGQILSVNVLHSWTGVQFCPQWS